MYRTITARLSHAASLRLKLIPPDSQTGQAYLDTFENTNMTKEELRHLVQKNLHRLGFPHIRLEDIVLVVEPWPTKAQPEPEGGPYHMEADE